MISPSLFLLFINDIINYSRSPGYISNADDTNAYLSSPCIDELFREANIVLEICERWFDCDRHTLNASKSQYMIFHRKQIVGPIHYHKLFIGNEEICRVASAKFLGVIIDEHFSWDLHVSTVARKLSKYSPIVFKLRNLLTRSLTYSNLIYLNSFGVIVNKPLLNPLYWPSAQRVKVYGTPHQEETYYNLNPLLRQRWQSY